MATVACEPVHHPGGSSSFIECLARENCGFNMPVQYTGIRQEVGRKKEEMRVSKGFYTLNLALDLVLDF